VVGGGASRRGRLALGESGAPFGYDGAMNASSDGTDRSLWSQADFEAAVEAADARSFAWWEHSVTVYERAVETVFDALDLGPEARARAVLACARHVHPFALEQGLVEARDYGLGLFEDLGHDPTALVQLDRVQAWLEQPGPASLSAVTRCVDESRQQQMWDEDMCPPPGQGWPLMLEVVDLLCRSIKQSEEGRPDCDQGYPTNWPAGVAARRAVVCALKVRVRDDEAAAAREVLGVLGG